MLARRAWHMLSQGRPEDPQGQKSGGTRLPGFVRSRRSDKPGLHQGGGGRKTERPPSTSHSPPVSLILLLLIQEVRPGPRLSGMGKGRARHFGRNPTPAHARFAELGLVPRPEGKEPSRLKASSNWARAADCDYGRYCVRLSVGFCC